MNCTKKRMQMMYQFIEDLDDQVEMAVGTAFKSKNPVDGYRNAVERIEESFEGMNAPFIAGSIKDMLLRILNARVGILMRKVECEDCPENEECC